MAVSATLEPAARQPNRLSEHQWEGWIAGCLLTGRQGLFDCYEALSGGRKLLGGSARPICQSKRLPISRTQRYPCQLPHVFSTK